MAVRWPDGSVTGSVRREPAPAPVEPPLVKPSAPVTEKKKKEVEDGDR